MTITEFHRNFRFGLDKMDGLNYPNFLPEEIDLLLNQAQDRITKQRYGDNNLKRESFEETQKRIEDLKELIVSTVIRPTLSTNTLNLNDNIAPNSVFCNLPTDHWFVIQERAVISCTSCVGSTILVRVDSDSGTTSSNPITLQLTGRFAEVTPTTHLEFGKIYKDAFRKPNKDRILRMMYQDKVELIPASDCTILAYQYRYIKQPRRMDLNGNITCELSEHLHQEIVDEAVKIALEGIEAKRNQSFGPIIDNQKE
jgi:hypothetical protein